MKTFIIAVLLVFSINTSAETLTKKEVRKKGAEVISCAVDIVSEKKGGLEGFIELEPLLDNFFDLSKQVEEREDWSVETLSEYKKILKDCQKIRKLTSQNNYKIQGVSILETQDGRSLGKVYEASFNLRGFLIDVTRQWTICKRRTKTTTAGILVSLAGSFGYTSCRNSNGYSWNEIYAGSAIDTMFDKIVKAIIEGDKDPHIEIKEMIKFGAGIVFNDLHEVRKNTKLPEGRIRKSKDFIGVAGAGIVLSQYETINNKEGFSGSISKDSNTGVGIGVGMTGSELKNTYIRITPIRRSVKNLYALFYGEFI